MLDGLHALSKVISLDKYWAHHISPSGHPHYPIQQKLLAPIN